MHDRWNAFKAFAVLAGLTLFATEGVNYSQIGPFFPTEASNCKNISTFSIGVITGAFDVVSFITAVTSASFINPINQKMVYCSGALLSATCNGLFGVMVYSKGGPMFVVLCILLRALMGTGASLVYSTGVPLLVLIHPKWSGRITSLTETAFGLGIMIGPLVGSVLYSIGGYLLPFLFAAVSQILLAVLCIFVLPNKAAKSYEKIQDVSSDTSLIESETNTEISTNVDSTFKYFATRPIVLGIALPLAFHSSTTGFLDVALSPYLLDKFNVNGDTAGLYFLAFLATYTIEMPLLGLLVDRGYAGKIFLISCLEGAFGFGLMSLPYQVLSIESKPWTVFCLIIMGSANAGSYAAVYLIFEKLAYDIGFKKENNVKLFTAALANACFASGRMLGTVIIDGIFLDHFDFYRSCLLLSGLLLASAVLSGYVLRKKRLLQNIFYQNQQTEHLIGKQAV